MTREEFRQEIITNVSNYPTNVSAALRLSAKKAKKTVRAATNLYYNTKDGVRMSDPCFIIHTVSGVYINTKQVGVKKEGPRSLHLNTGPISLKGMPDSDKIALFDILIKG